MGDASAGHDSGSQAAPPLQTDARVECLEQLRSSCASSDLALYLGAGVSLSAGLPNWETLLHRLTVEMWQQRLGEQVSAEEAEAFARLFRQASGGFPLISGRHIRSALGREFQQRLLALLYADAAGGSPLLDAIVRLCAPADGHGRPGAVVSYNYDDLLETRLAASGVSFRSIYGEGQSPRPRELPIYHVHGYLPRDGSLVNKVEIVFAEDAYHTQFLDPYGWANITQLNLMRERTGLFIGLSMTDPNLRRLLDVAHRHDPERRHYAVLKGPSEKDVGDATGGEPPGRREAFVRALRDVQEDALADLGLRVLWVDGFDEIPALLDGVRG